MAELLIRAVELIEAEARALREGLVRLGVGFILLFIAGALVLSGTGLLLWSFYLSLAECLTPASAALIVGLCALLIAGGLMWVAKRIVR